MNIRVGVIFVTQSLPYHPMPVGTKAITPSIPNAEEEPGEGSKGNSNQMQLSRLLKNPAGYIKQCKYCMKNKEENIEDTVPHMQQNMRFLHKTIKGVSLHQKYLTRLYYHAFFLKLQNKKLCDVLNGVT